MGKVVVQIGCEEMSVSRTSSFTNIETQLCGSNFHKSVQVLGDTAAASCQQDVRMWKAVNVQNTNIAPQQAKKLQRGNTGIALLFL